MAHIVDVELEGRSRYRVGEKIDRPIRVLLRSGGQSDTAKPMLWQTGVAQIDDSHERCGIAPDLALYIFNNATLGGGGAMPKYEGKFIANAAVFPHYVTYFIKEGIGGQFWSEPENTTERRIACGISVIHHNLVFGHWLIEMMPKLLLLKFHCQHLASVPIILPYTTPNYVIDFIREFMRGWNILLFDRFSERIVADVLICPGLCDDAYHFHPEFNVLIERHIAWARMRSWKNLIRSSVSSKPRYSIPESKNIFVSRRGVTSLFRELTNAEELEDIALERGFTVVQPETLPWHIQVHTFSRANCVVGEFGSGIHNALFSRKDTKVVCLNWIVDTQSRISNFRGQRVGYILPNDNLPRLFGLDGRHLRYEIDADIFRSRIEHARRPE